jgi:UDP-N-acetylmuramoyl-L-alanyl-D-glutamate--2,6-diaminopimelate ligase
MRTSIPDPSASDARAGALAADGAERVLHALTRPVRAAFPWAESFLTVGVTGTNGKTSTTHLLASIVRAAGHHVVCESTLGHFFDGERVAIEPSERGFYASMQRAAAADFRHAVVEVTSKALMNGYAEKWRFDHGLFTNLTRDHVAEHGSWEHYLASKAQLFVHLGPGRTAVLNACDEPALLLDRAIPADVRRVWYGAPTRGPALRAVDLAAERLEPTLAGTHVTLVPSPLAEELGRELELALIGEVYAENALAAAAFALTNGFGAGAVHAGARACSRLAGRFEVVRERPYVVLDYAHTPDALARTCDTARRLAGSARLLVVFGAAGGYDSPKREAMGEAVGARADFAFITNENPNHEDPRAIMDALERGCHRAGKAAIRVVVDRAEAIRRALDEARDGDFVLVSGRGRDEGMSTRAGVVAYSDADVIGSATPR